MAEASAATFLGKESIFYSGKTWTFSVTKKNHIKYFLYTDVSDDPSAKYLQVKNKDGTFTKVDAGRGIITVTILKEASPGLRLYLINKNDQLEEYCLDEGEGKTWSPGSLSSFKWQVGKYSDLSATPQPIRVVYQAPDDSEYLTMAWVKSGAWRQDRLTNFVVDE